MFADESRLLDTDAPPPLSLLNSAYRLLQERALFHLTLNGSKNNKKKRQHILKQINFSCNKGRYNVVVGGPQQSYINIQI